MEENVDKAYMWLKRAADGGHVLSQAMMGELELHLNENPSAAVPYLEKASAAGYLRSMNTLARIYCDGAEGVPMNKPRAIELYKKVAAAGYAEAQSNLGGCYYKGDGVPENYYEAFHWVSMAAEQGNGYAQKTWAFSTGMV